MAFNFYKQYELMYTELATKTKGDKVVLDGRVAYVVDILSANEDGNFVISHDTYNEEDDSRIIVRPDDVYEFYSENELDDLFYDEHPENADFGFVLNGEGMFEAYTDWQWDDCYCDMLCPVVMGVNLVVTENTVVKPVYYPYDEYGDDFTITGMEYFELRDNEDLQTEKNVRVYKSTAMYVEEVMEDGRSTGEVERLSEIYSP